MNNNKGTCPVCNGTKRIDAGDARYRHVTAGYNKDDNTLPCTNCGGQRMFGEPSGLVHLRTDGTPCTHSYTGRSGGRCYTIYTCQHCPDSYSIDSGD